MADTEHEVEIKHNLDEYAAKIKETNDLWDQHLAKVKAVNDELTKISKMRGASTGSSSGYGSSSDRDLDRRYKRNFETYQKDFHAFTTIARSAGSAGGVIGGGLYSMATGGGLSGFARGFSQLGRQLQGSNSFASLVLSGAAMGAVSRTRGAGRGAGAGAAAAAEEEGIESAVAAGAKTGIDLGLINAFGKLPGLIGGAIALAGADIYAVDKATKDVYGRSRRAGGYGANIGQLTAFDNTMSRYVDTDAMMAAMGQAKYDFTSPAYLAAKISGIHPSEWKDPAAMAEGTILAVQRQLKGWSAERMLPLAHSRGFQNLGLSDQDLIRLYTGSQKDVNDLVKKAQGAAPSLDQSDALQQKYKNLQTDIDLAGARLRVMGEDILSDQIPAFQKLAKMINAITDAYKVSPDIPAIGATPQSLSVFGGGGFAIPGGRGGYIGGGGAGGGSGGLAPTSAEVQKLMDSGNFPDTMAGHEAFARTVAAKYGINPDLFAGIGKAEGNNPLGWKRPGQGSSIDVDPNGVPFSYGDYQFNMHKGALGDIMLREAGIDARDPKQWQKATDWAARYMAKNGLGPWRGDAVARRWMGKNIHTGSAPEF